MINTWDTPRRGEAFRKPRTHANSGGLILTRAHQQVLLVSEQRETQRTFFNTLMMHADMWPAAPTHTRLGPGEPPDALRAKLSPGWRHAAAPETEWE